MISVVLLTGDPGGPGSPRGPASPWNNITLFSTRLFKGKVLSYFFFLLTPDPDTIPTGPDFSLNPDAMWDIRLT